MRTVAIIAAIASVIYAASQWSPTKDVTDSVDRTVDKVDNRIAELQKQFDRQIAELKKQLLDSQRECDGLREQLAQKEAAVPNETPPDSIGVSDTQPITTSDPSGLPADGDDTETFTEPQDELKDEGLLRAEQIFGYTYSEGGEWIGNVWHYRGTPVPMNGTIQHRASYRGGS